MSKLVSQIKTYIKNMNNKDRVVLSGALLVLVLFLGLKFVLIPQIDKYLDGTDQLKVLEERYNDIVSKSAENIVLTEQTEIMQEDFKNAVRGVPKTARVAQIANDIRAMLKEKNLELVTIGFKEDIYDGDKDKVKYDENGNEIIDRGVGFADPDNQTEEPVKDNSIIKMQVVNLTFRGDYINSLEFFDALERYNRIADISNVSIAENDREGLVTSLNINFYNLNFDEKEVYNFNDGEYGKENIFE